MKIAVAVLVACATLRTQPGQPGFDAAAVQRGAAHDFYTRTNALAYSLDDSRQTGGIRNRYDSELLEDVIDGEVLPGLVANVLHPGISSRTSRPASSHASGNAGDCG